MCMEMVKTQRQKNVPKRSYGVDISKEAQNIITITTATIISITIIIFFISVTIYYLWNFVLDILTLTSENNYHYSHLISLFFFSP